MSNKCIIIGLIGGICAGKSTISKILQERGAHVIDADKMGHLAYAKHTECFQSLVRHYGTRIVSKCGSDECGNECVSECGSGKCGEIDRRVLGSIVFADKEELHALNALVWPALRELLEKEIARVRSECVSEGVRVVVLEAAVLLEAGWTDLVDEVWAVEVEREASVQRLMQRNSLTEEQARQRVVAQCSSEERRVAAQRVFDNNECVSERVSGGVSERLRDEVLAALESVKATVVE